MDLSKFSKIDKFETTPSFWLYLQRGILFALIGVFSFVMYTKGYSFFVGSLLAVVLCFSSPNLWWERRKVKKHIRFAGFHELILNHAARTSITDKEILTFEFDGISSDHTKYLKIPGKKEDEQEQEIMFAEGTIKKAPRSEEVYALFVKRTEENESLKLATQKMYRLFLVVLPIVVLGHHWITGQGAVYFGEGFGYVIVHALTLFFTSVTSLKVEDDQDEKDKIKVVNEAIETFRKQNGYSEHKTIYKTLQGQIMVEFYHVHTNKLIASYFVVSY